MAILAPVIDFQGHNLIIFKLWFEESINFEQ